MPSTKPSDQIPREPSAHRHRPAPNRPTGPPTNFQKGTTGHEVVFRFGVYQAARTGMPAVLAALLSSLAFGLAHMGYPDPVKMGMSILAGLVFIWTYERTGSIFAPILVHAANNFVSAVWL